MGERMSRPEFPNCILPVSCIQRIREEQTYYDENPERAEREQQTREERRREELLLEQMREAEYRRNNE